MFNYFINFTAPVVLFITTKAVILATVVLKEQQWATFLSQGPEG